MKVIFWLLVLDVEIRLIVTIVLCIKVIDRLRIRDFSLLRFTDLFILCLYLVCGSFIIKRCFKSEHTFVVNLLEHLSLFLRF
jgi:hypothetical protein